jgi:branched-chain amino acid transport system permease protein
MAAPLLAVEIGMGERVLITTFVVIVIGGVGSVRGAMAGALLVGMVDSLGRAYLPDLLDRLLTPEVATPWPPAWPRRRFTCSWRRC